MKLFSFARIGALVYSLFLSLTAFAGNTLGNGGDAVICFSQMDARNEAKTILESNHHTIINKNPFEIDHIRSAISSVEILDLYEYLLPVGFPPMSHKLITVNQPFTDFLVSSINTLKQTSELGQILEQALIDLQFSNWHAAPGVVDMDDSNEAIILPYNCLLVQMAVRQDNHVYYDEILFSFLSEVQKAGLIFHELLYKIAVSQNPPRQSRHARVVTGLLLSKDETNLTPEDFAQRVAPLVSVSFPETIAGQKLWIRAVNERWPQSGAKKRVTVVPTSLRIGDFEGLVNDQLELSEDQKIVRFKGSIKDALKTALNANVTVENGVIRTMTFEANIKAFVVQGFTCESCLGLRFDSTGRLIAFNSPYQKIVGPSSIVMVKGWAEFYPETQIVKTVSTGLIQKWNTKYRIFTNAADCSNIRFYSDGQLASACFSSSGTEKIQVSLSPSWTYIANTDFFESSCKTRLELDVLGNAVSLIPEDCLQSYLWQYENRIYLNSIKGIDFLPGTGVMAKAKVNRFALLKIGNQEKKLDQGDVVFDNAGKIISLPPILAE